MRLTTDQEYKLNKLAEDNPFFRSLWNQYNDYGSLSEKQIERIDNAYETTKVNV